MLDYYLSNDNLLIIWMKKTLFTQGSICMFDVYKSISHDYKAFIMSKDVNIWKHYCPELDIPAWMESFKSENLIKNLDDLLSYYHTI